MANGSAIQFLLAGICAADGEPLIGGKVTTYAAGTVTPKATYTNRAQSIAAANPIILDSRGTAKVFGVGGYKFVITDANDAAVVTIDDVYILDPLSAGADINLANTYRVTNANDASAIQDYATISDVQRNRGHWYGTAGGTANAITANRPYTYAAYVTGEIIQLKASNSNTADAPTLNISALGAKTILRLDGKTCRKGDIVSGGIYEFIYDGTNYLLLNPSPTWQDWTPAFSASGSMTIGSLNIREARYKVNLSDEVQFEVTADYTTGGTQSTSIYISLPTAATAHHVNCNFICSANDGGGGVLANGGRWRCDATPRVVLFTPTVANWTLGVTASCSIKGSYKLG